MNAANSPRRIGAVPGQMSQPISVGWRVRKSRPVRLRKMPHNRGVFLYCERDDGTASNLRDGMIEFI